MRWLAARTLSALLVALSSCVPTSDGLPSEEESSAADALSALAPGVPQQEGDASAATVVYEAIRTVDATGQAADVKQSGELPRWIQDRVSRPWSYFDEPTLFHEQAWSRSLDDGSTEYGYRVLSTSNLEPVLPPPAKGPPVIGNGLQKALAAEGSTRVAMTVRGLPEWNVTPRPITHLSAADLEDYANERAASLAAREELAAQLVQPVIDAIEGNEGTVLVRPSASAVIEAMITPNTLAVLELREDLFNIDAVGAPMISMWDLGDSRSDARLGTERFWNQGYNGEVGFSPEVVVAVADYSTLEDEACFLFDSANCTGNSRLQERLECYNYDSDLDPCEYIANFIEDDSYPDHGTPVSSTILADYRQNQCEGYTCGDNTTTHSTIWEDDATGFAPEARLIYIDLQGGDGTATASDSFADVVTRDVDIYNGSWGSCAGTEQCNVSSITAIEQKLEDAFDDGVLVVMAAGNRITCSGNCNPWTTCSVASPSDTLKAFAVNAFDSSTSACNSDYNSCVLDPCYYRLGGAAVVVNGINYPAGITGIALVAPNRFGYATNLQGAQGTTGPAQFAGTSASAPVVAGVAATVKDQYLATGQTWVNGSGWMNAIMLSMGDRHYKHPNFTNTIQATTGGSVEYGFGKLRPRLLGTGGGLGAIGTAFYSLSFGPGATEWTTVLWPTSLPASTGVVKCVMFQAEDMSPPKTQISNVDIDLELYSPFQGNSCSPLGSYWTHREDVGRDVKSMVAFDAPDTALSGRCVRLRVKPLHIHSTINTKTVCYYSTIDDDQPPSGP